MNEPTMSDIIHDEDLKAARMFAEYGNGSHAGRRSLRLRMLRHAISKPFNAEQMHMLLDLLTDIGWTMFDVFPTLEVHTPSWSKVAGFENAIARLLRTTVTGVGIFEVNTDRTYKNPAVRDLWERYVSFQVK